MKGRLDKVLATLSLISRTDAQSAMKGPGDGGRHSRP